MQNSKGLRKVVTGLNELNEKERFMKEKEIKMRRMNSLNEPYDIKTLIYTQVVKNVNIFSFFFIILFILFIFFFCFSFFFQWWIKKKKWTLYNLIQA